MKTRAFGLLVIPTIMIALPGCLDEPTCPYGEVLVHDGYHGDGVCVRRSYLTPTPSGTTTPPSASSTPPPAPASGEGTSGGDTTAPPTTAPTTPAAATCGGVAATSDSVRVVDKNDASPTFPNNGNASNLADGSYTLVQATNFRTSDSSSPVRSLKASLDIKGPTLTVNAQDTSVTGMPDESLTFLLPSAGVMTKTCESMHGSVSAWFFPFSVGSATQPQLAYDGQSGFVRVVVARSDGATELVFAK